MISPDDNNSKACGKAVRKQLSQVRVGSISARDPNYLEEEGRARQATSQSRHPLSLRLWIAVLLRGRFRDRSHPSIRHHVKRERRRRRSGQSKARALEKVERRSRSSRGNHGVIKLARGILTCRFQIVHFQIRHLFENLSSGKPGSEKSKHIDHPNPHAADARSPAALLSVYGDSIHQFRHGLEDRPFE